LEKNYEKNYYCCDCRYFFGRKEKNGKSEYIPVKARRGKVAITVETTGEVAPLNRVEIIPNVSGRIDKILVREGDKIEAGQVLALMSSADRTAILDAAFSMGEKEYEYWKDAYKPVKIISPISGTLILRNVVEGQTVTSSAKLFAIADRLIVEAYVDESEIGKVKKGQAAAITLDAYPKRVVRGRVVQILDEGRNVSNVITYTVKIRPFRSPSFFKSQMTANVKIFVSGKEKRLLIPSLAIVPDRDGNPTVVTGFDRKGNPVFRAVKIGENIGRDIAVLKGLQEGHEIWMKKEKYSLEKKKQGKFFLSPRGKVKRQERRALHRMR